MEAGAGVGGSDDKGLHENGNYEDVEPSSYYGVHIPSDVQTAENEITVFTNKVDALKLVKKYKKARFKVFSYYHEADEFAQYGSENMNNNSGIFNRPMKESINKIVTDAVTNVSGSEKQFKGPTPQNLVFLRRNIEQGDLKYVNDTIWDNPRFLIGAGDTPCILQEGCRYNALHVAAKQKNAEMCELILNTISNIEFVKKLYADDRNPAARAKILLDLYLNTPDKGLNETPLHFAVKFGAAKCVEVLASFPQCDKNLRNKYGKLPSEIICERYDGPDAISLRHTIANLLKDNYYVPVLRAEDNCAPPTIGEPFSPTKPPNLNKDPLSPRLEIHAYAGPMNKEGAEKFRRMWKTSPRTPLSPLAKSNSLNNSVDSVDKMNMDDMALLKLQDPEKGLERLGKNLAKKFDVGWKEYWPFLDSFVDIASDEGLKQFEEYLKEKSLAILGNASTVSLNSSPPKSGDSSPPKPELSPISDLCRALQACSLNTSRKNSNSFDNDTSQLNPFLYIDKSLQVFARRIANDILHLLNVNFEDTNMLETQIKQFKLLMASYMDDSRFASVDFHLVHSRITQLIIPILKSEMKDFSKLGEHLNEWLHYCNRDFECFSSDDESVHDKENAKVQHTVCILKSIQINMTNGCTLPSASNEDDYVALWKELKPCSCVWSGKINKKNFISKRSNSLKYSRNHSRFENPRKLSFSDDESDARKTESPKPIFPQKSDSDSEAEDADEFFTPPGSPSLVLSSDEDDDVFEDTQLPEREVFIEGDIPTKTDYSVYRALTLSNCKINSKDYPYVYHWQQAVDSYSDSEKRHWSNPAVVRYQMGLPQDMSTPVKKLLKLNTSMGSPISVTPGPVMPSYIASKSWMRITGINSPRKSLRGNQSFNL